MPGCTCGHHTMRNPKCVVGCTCRRHSRRRCQPGCTCGHHSYRPKPIPYEQKVSRFWSKCRREGACLLWTGAGSRGKGNGYGCMKWAGKMRNTHVIAFLLSHGPVPDGKEVCHTRNCTSKLCCEPTHLYAGTRSENVRDSIAIGTFGDRSNNNMTPERSRQMLEARRFRFEEKRRLGIPLRRSYASG